MNFIEDLGINGHLQIAKKDKFGNEEIIFDDHNIIVSGMGLVLSLLYAVAGSTKITDYQIDRCQVGTGGSAGFEVTGTNKVQTPLPSYGTDTDILTVSGSITTVVGTNILTQTFLKIPHSKITRIGDNSVRYTIVLDEEAGNGNTLNEVGLYSANPFNVSPSRSILVAYRYFSSIAKTNDFSLIFRWTLNF